MKIHVYKHGPKLKVTTQNVTVEFLPKEISTIERTMLSIVLHLWNETDIVLLLGDFTDKEIDEVQRLIQDAIKASF